MSVARARRGVASAVTALLLVALTPGCSWLLGIGDDPVVVDPSGSDAGSDAGEDGAEDGAEDADAAKDAGSDGAAEE